MLRQTIGDSDAIASGLTEGGLYLPYKFIYYLILPQYMDYRLTKRVLAHIMTVPLLWLLGPPMFLLDLLAEENHS